ncbi:cytochrome P450 [Pseudonocardia yuanmonensis]
MRADRTIELVRTGYPWGARVRGGRTGVRTRVLGRSAVLVGGAEGVRRFYDPRLRRRGSFPPPIKLLLFGPRTVHGLDDTEHRLRKALYLDVITAETTAELGRRAERLWEEALDGAAGGAPVVLFDEAVRVLAEAVLPWAGVPLAEGELPLRARQLATVLDGFATPGRPYARAVAARVPLGRWARRLVRGVRAGTVSAPGSSALYAAACARDEKGTLLPEREAATTLLNVVRPTVATAWFIAFAGLALHEYPEWRRRIASGDEAALGAFAQEVRRYYPFVPVLTARARTRQTVLGLPIRRGGLVLLDVHGTDHDPAHWTRPDRFDPERFLTGEVDPDALVPQGGGDVSTGHRCPGEGVVLTMIAVAARVLARRPLELPPQDLRYDLSRVPTRPSSGVVLRVGQDGGAEEAGRVQP